jgi:uncharacterized protein (DUF58 family)
MTLLFDETTLRRLEQLTLVADKVRVGAMKGDRRSQKRGTSIEFADYRDYSKGDDLRRLDWNVYARLQRPFIKLLEEEEDLAVHVLIDASASMGWPEDAATHKFDYARRLAAGLGHIALSSGDLLRVTLIGSQERSWGPFRGRGHSVRLFEFLESAESAGQTDLNQSLKAIALRGRRPGLLFLISDLLSPGGFYDGLNALQARGYEVVLLHLLSPDEIEPPLAGDIKLIDVETGADAEITLDFDTLTRYRERFAAWQADIAARCQQRGVTAVFLSTATPWDKLLLQLLRERGVVK